MQLLKILGLLAIALLLLIPLLERFSPQPSEKQGGRKECPHQHEKNARAVGTHQVLQAGPQTTNGPLNFRRTAYPQWQPTAGR